MRASIVLRMETVSEHYLGSSCVCMSLELVGAGIRLERPWIGTKLAAG